MKKLEQGEMCEIWAINPLIAVTQKSDYFSHLFGLLLYSTMPFPELTIMSFDALIEIDIASYCRWIKGVIGLLAQNIYKTRRFVILLTTMVMV